MISWLSHSTFMFSTLKINGRKIKTICASKHLIAYRNVMVNCTNLRVHIHNSPFVNHHCPLASLVLQWGFLTCLRLLITTKRKRNCNWFEERSGKLTVWEIVCLIHKLILKIQYQKMKEKKSEPELFEPEITFHDKSWNKTDSCYTCIWLIWI